MDQTARDNYFGAYAIDALWDRINYLANYTPPLEERRRSEEEKKTKDENTAGCPPDRGS